MDRKYKCYTDITKELLDTIKVGDLVKINNWSKPMRVKAVSKNYFVMTQKIFGTIFYSVCSKIPWEGIRHNAMVGGMFHCGTDNWLFGSPLCSEYDDVYSFENPESNALYLQEFEDGKSQLSERSGCAIYKLFIKHGGK